MLANDDLTVDANASLGEDVEESTLGSGGLLSVSMSEPELDKIISMGRREQGVKIYSGLVSIGRHVPPTLKMTRRMGTAVDIKRIISARELKNENEVASTNPSLWFPRLL